MKKVLLYSGGMDSVMLKHLLKPDTCIYFNTLGRYSEKEIKNLTSDVLVINLSIGQWEREDLILPSRNAYFALAAANYGDDIFLGATYGDRSYDKNETFCKKTSNLLSYMYQKQHWTEERKITVSAPYKDYTKAEILKEYLNTNGDYNSVLNSISCYHPTKKHCGECKPCARKWVAFKVNGFNIKELFEKDPASYFTESMVELMKWKKYRGEKEDNEILKALEIK